MVEEAVLQVVLFEGIEIIPVKSLGQFVEHLYGLNPISPFRLTKDQLQASSSTPDGIVDFSAIKGQEHVKRALEIAARSNHNIRLMGRWWDDFLC